jgi:hypothetical protein
MEKKTLFPLPKCVESVTLLIHLFSECRKKKHIFQHYDVSLLGDEECLATLMVWAMGL